MNFFRPKKNPRRVGDSQRSPWNSFFKKRNSQSHSNSPKRAETIRDSRVGRHSEERLSGTYLAVTTLVITVVCACLVYHLKVRFDGVRLGYETSRARALQTRLLLEQRELRLELASLKSPEKIEEDARDRLQMEVPEHDRIVPIERKRKAVSVSGGAL